MPCAPWQLRRSFKLAYYSHTTKLISESWEKHEQATNKNTNNQPNPNTKQKTVKRCELVPLKASLRCTPQWCSPSSNSLSHIPKHVCIYDIIRSWRSLFRLLWIFQLIDPILCLPFLLPTGGRWMFGNLSWILRRGLAAHQEKVVWDWVG